MKVGGCIAGLAAGGLVLFWGLFWSAATLYFDYTCVAGLLQQHRATSYASTDGRVLESRVDVSYDSDGDSYSAVIRYAYEVKGREYIGDRIRYGTKSGGKRPSQAFVDHHPRGATVKVYYDPLKPAESVLQTGIGGVDLLMVIFLIPFNAIMLGCWYAGFYFIRGSIAPPKAGGVKIIETGVATRVRLPERRALLWGASAGTLVAFLAVFVLAFAYDTDPTVAAAVTALALSAGTGIVVYTHVSAPVRNGSQDLVIDEARQRLTLPCTQKRTLSVELPMQNLRRVEVEVKESKDSEGDVVKEYIPTLVYFEGNGEQSAGLTSFSDADSANSLAEWLRERLGLQSGQAVKV